MLTEKWRIHLFGTATAIQGANVVSKFATRHNAWLFAYLAFNLPKSVHRETMAEMLWPNADPETGRARLRVSLASLRRQLEPPGTRPGSILVADRSTLSLNPEACWVDAVDFRNLVEAGLSDSSASKAAAYLIQADDLYGRPFCQGLESSWISDERSALMRLQISGQMRLSQILARSGDLLGAIRHARRAVQADPLCEPARRVLIRMLLQSGNDEAAQVEFESFAGLLKRETGLSPQPETVQVLHAVASRDANAFAEEEETHEAVAVSPARKADSSSRLPRFLDRYIEREDELSTLAELVQLSRLVTVTGSGGLGKSRLAVELLQNWVASYGGEVWFVAIQREGAKRLLDRVLEGIDPNRTPDPDSLRQILVAIQDLGLPTSTTPILLVIDGCEILPESAHLQLTALLRAVPSLRILATSRRKLGLVGEQEYPLSPLDLPDGNEGTDPEKLSSFPSVRLFVVRAQAVQPDFQLTRANGSDVFRICRALDGIPLAIELAAARVRKSSLREMVEELEGVRECERSVGSPTRGSRALSAAIGWSFERLSPEDRKALAQLTVFEAFWDAPAADAVIEISDTGPALERLRENSLIVREDFLGQARYRFLASVRSYAAQQMTDEERAVVEGRRASYFLHRALQFGAACLHVGVFGSNTLWHERQNLDSTLEWFASQPERGEDLCKLVNALTWYWTYSGRARFGRQWVEKARLSQAAKKPNLEARLDLTEGFLACYQDDAVTAASRLEKAVEGFKVLDSPQELAHAQWCLGFASYVSGKFELSKQLLLSTLERLGDHGASWWVAATDNLLGFVFCAEGELDEAERRLIQSRELWNGIGERHISFHSELGLARVCWLQGKIEDAEKRYLGCLAEFSRIEDPRGITYSIEGLARVTASQKRYRSSARLLGAAQRQRDDHGLNLDVADESLSFRIRGLVEAALENRFQPEWQFGYQHSNETVRHYHSSDAVKAPSVENPLSI